MCLSRRICLTGHFCAWASVDSARTLAVQGCERGSFLDLIGHAVSLTKASPDVLHEHFARPEPAAERPRRRPPGAPAVHPHGHRSAERRRRGAWRCHRWDGRAARHVDLPRRRHAPQAHDTLGVHRPLLAGARGSAAAATATGSHRGVEAGGVHGQQGTAVDARGERTHGNEGGKALPQFGQM